jgi:hypothetical protein
VGQQDATRGTGPCQDVRIWQLHQANVLHAQEIQTRQPGEPSAGEPAVEVLIRQKAEQRPALAAASLSAAPSTSP